MIVPNFKELGLQMKKDQKDNWNDSQTLDTSRFHNNTNSSAMKPDTYRTKNSSIFENIQIS